MYPLGGLYKNGIFSNGTYPFQSNSEVLPSNGINISAFFLIGIFEDGLHPIFPFLSAKVQF